MKGDKGSLIIIIVLLVIFIPLTIIGFLNNKEVEENPSHLLYYEDKIWFYKEDRLLGTYSCKVPSCTLASTNSEDDNLYGVNIYTSDDVNQVKVNNFALIRDENKIILYNVKTNTVIAKYNSLKNYNNMLDYCAILENDSNKWGVLSYKEDISSVIPFEYDYIGVTNKVEDTYLNTNYYVVKKDNNWFIVDNTNNEISDYFNEVIMDYSVTDNYLVLVFKSSINVYSRSNKELIDTTSFNGSFNTLDTEVNNNKLDIKLDGNTIKSVYING